MVLINNLNVCGIEFSIAKAQMFYGNSCRVKRLSRGENMRKKIYLISFFLMIGIFAGAEAQDISRAQSFTAWSKPVNLGPTINSTSDDVAPALSRDERSLYFTSNRSGGFGGEDIWVARRRSPNSKWGTPVNLGPTINSGANERLRYLSSDGHL